MTIHLKCVQNVEEGLKSKNKKPFVFNNYPQTVFINKHLKIGNEFREYKNEKIEWLNHKCYINFDIANKNGETSYTNMTFVGDKFLDDIKLLITFSEFVAEMTNVMAWIGGVVGVITAIKEFILSLL